MPSSDITTPKSCVDASTTFFSSPHAAGRWAHLPEAVPHPAEAVGTARRAHATAMDLGLTACAKTVFGLGRRKEVSSARPRGRASPPASGTRRSARSPDTACAPDPAPPGAPDGRSRCSVACRDAAMPDPPRRVFGSGAPAVSPAARGAPDDPPPPTATPLRCRASQVAVEPRPDVLRETYGYLADAAPADAFGEGRVSVRPVDVAAMTESYGGGAMLLNWPGWRNHLPAKLGT